MPSCVYSYNNIMSITLAHILADSIVVLHKPTFATLGGRFEFNCTVNGGGSATAVESFNWYHNDSVINVNQPNSRFSAMNSQWSSKLLVTGAQREDGGEYYCEAIFANRSETSNRHTLQIEGKRGLMYCS